jgi:hypothetical protein
VGAGRSTNEGTSRDQGDSQKPLARRGLLRAAAGVLAASAGAVAFLSHPKQALASANVISSADTQATYEFDDTSSGAGVWGRNTAGGGPSTPITPAGVTGTAGGAIQGVAGTCTGAPGLGGSWGVYGESDVGVGVRGATFGSSGAGVYATSFATSGGGTGVFGEASGGATSIGVSGHNYNGGTGVYGQSNDAIGVWGVTNTSGQGLANPAVAGTNNGGGAALVGFTAGPSSIGLGGATNAGVGVYGSSTTGAGVAGYTSTGVAVGGTATGGGFAGYFSGPVFVNGSLTVTGGAKSAAVRSNGSLKRVYSMESPESWFEDFGSGQLSGGQATVSLESGFAGIVHTDAYRVFLTARGDSEGLFVADQNSSGFTVREQRGGKSNIGFDYRVVAKRADIAGARLEDVDEPPTYYQPPEPALDHAPKPPAPPDTQGDRSRH